MGLRLQSIDRKSAYCFILHMFSITVSTVGRTWWDWS